MASGAGSAVSHPTGSIEHDPEYVIAAAFDQAEARDPQHRRCWVVLVDGARHQRELIQAEAKRRGVQTHIVLDLVHVIEKLWAAARCFYPATDPDAEDWIAAKAARILRGCAARAADEIRAEADHRQLAGDERAAVDKACPYLAGNADFVHYDRAFAAGWPIASGVIEGAARHLIADRLDITGSRWSVPGTEAVLLLRAVHANGDLPEHWTWHTIQERKRLYPTPTSTTTNSERDRRSPSARTTPNVVRAHEPPASREAEPRLRCQRG
ncbi:hypothetical protein [Streptomyces sp. NPDC055006]